jgi:tetratricopeptide (TPR) repeat protein
LFKAIAGASKIISDHAMVFGSFSFISQLAVAFQIPFFYIGKMILPVKLSAEYVVDFSRSLVSIKALSSLSGLILIGAGVLIFRKKYREFIFSFAWFMICLLPVMNFFGTYPVVADRYVYLSSYVCYFFGVVVLLRVFNRNKWNGAIFIIPVIAAGLSLLSVERNSVWMTEKTLFENTVTASPQSVKAHGNLGTIYFNEGDYERAFNLFDKLKELNPSSVFPGYYRGLQRFNEGDFQGTIALLRDGGSLEIDYLLGRSYEMTGSTEKAIESYMNLLKSIELDPAGRRDFARQRLGRLRMTLSSELDVMRKRIKENPSDLNERIKLAIALDKAGLFDEAIEHYNELARLGGDNWVLFNNMANVYKKTDNYEKAILYYRKSLAMNSTNANAYNNLGLMLKKLRRYGPAIKAFEDSIKADSNFAYAPFNLAVLYFHLGDKENALKYFNFVQKRFPDFKERVIAYLSKIEK